MIPLPLKVQTGVISLPCWNSGEVRSDFAFDPWETRAVGTGHCRFQGYDGASNMSSQARGVQGLITQKKTQGVVRTLQFACPRSRYSKGM